MVDADLGEERRSPVPLEDTFLGALPPPDLAPPRETGVWAG